MVKDNGIFSGIRIKARVQRFNMASCSISQPHLWKMSCFLMQTFPFAWKRTDDRHENALQQSTSLKQIANESMELIVFQQNIELRNHFKYYSF